MGHKEKIRVTVAV